MPWIALGAIRSADSVERVGIAAKSGRVLLESRTIDPPLFPDAVVQTPLIVQVDGEDREAYLREMFGPRSPDPQRPCSRRSGSLMFASRGYVFGCDRELEG